MIVFPNCKINLGLNILALRPDGFHDIETVFYPVALNDALEIIPAPDGLIQFTSTGLSIPGDAEANLCLKAFRLLQADFGLPGVKMHLHKVIPMGSGLGGGSSDGAFALKLINDLFALGLVNDQLGNYARRLGSDCAFFIGNQPQFASERGDHLKQSDISLTGLYLVLAIPEIHVNTAGAYRMAAPRMPAHPLKELIRHPIEAWKDLLVNDFEKPVFKKHPRLGEIKQKLYDAGAIYAAMSGSGSALYGLFDGGTKPEIQLPGCFTWISQL